MNKRKSDQTDAELLRLARIITRNAKDVDGIELTRTQRRKLERHIASMLLTVGVSPEHRSQRACY